MDKTVPPGAVMLLDFIYRTIDRRCRSPPSETPHI
jgi:hypothetical protein